VHCPVPGNLTGPDRIRAELIFIQLKNKKDKKDKKKKKKF
jgi:hypothetical protein